MNIASTDTSLLKCLSILNENKGYGVPIVNEASQMIAFLFDGDIRRALISGSSLDSPCIDAANTNFYFVHDPRDINSQDLLSLRCIPVLHDDKTISHFVFSKNSLYPLLDSIAAFIAAGGKGTRLMPLTKDIPKPLVKLHDVPLIERIINKFVACGIKTIYISVNYMAEQIIDFLGDGSKWSINIIYLHEDKPLGTAGSLSLIKDIHHSCFLVTNGDIYSEINWLKLLNFHVSNDFNITITSVPYHVTVPFGVMKSSGYRFLSISEKPTYTYDCNAGIYALNADVLNLVPSDEFFDMTDLIDKASALDRPIGIYNLQEYWADIGNLTHYQQNQKMLQLLSDHLA